MQKKIITINEIVHTPIGILAKYSPEQLCALMQETSSEVEQAKRAKGWIELAIRLKYEEHIRAKRLRLEKDTGTVNIEDNGFKMTNELPKKVEWDQKQLKKIIAKLVTQGANIDDFVVTIYKVQEKKYKGWSSNLQNMFAPARIVRIGNATYKLTKINQAGVAV